jgi:hypothetical protein
MTLAHATAARYLMVPADPVLHGDDRDRERSSMTDEEPAHIAVDVARSVILVHARVVGTAQLNSPLRVSACASKAALATRHDRGLRP